jgi:PAS domain S-box-containing protein
MVTTRAESARSAQPRVPTTGEPMSGIDSGVDSERLVDELRRSEARYRALVEAASLDVFRTDAEGRLLTDMPGWRSVTGGERSLVGLGWLEDVHPADRDRVRQRWLEGSVATGLPFASEYRIVSETGAVRTISASAVPLWASDGRIQEWIGKSEDVTDDRLAEARASHLAVATAELASAVTVEDVVTIVLGTVCDLLEAGSCALHVLESGRDSPELVLLGERVQQDRAVPGGSDLVSATQSDGATRFTESPTARAALPLVAGSGQLGVWCLAWDTSRLFGEAEQAFIRTLAGQVAQALARAQLYEHSRSTARLLQRALLPDRLPAVPGLEVAARYRSAVGSDVGGDWYDVLDLSDGSAGLVLGDVMGRGVRAACTMGQVRNALRGIAVVDPTPVGMLRGLDRFFASFDPDEITTLVITVIDIATGALHVGNAGHLPPLLLRADGRSGQLDDGASTPLGVPTERVACKGTTLLPGDLLVMCSDGLIERRHWSLSDGLAVLERASRRLADAGLPLEEMADALLSEVLSGSPTDDDVSLLLVRLPA